MAVCGKQDIRILSETLQNIFSKVFYPKAIGVNIITGYGNHKHSHFTKDVIDEVLKRNANNRSIPVSLNEYTTPKLESYRNVRLLFAQGTKEIETDFEHSIKPSRSLKTIQSVSPKFLVILHFRGRLSLKQEEMRKIFQLYFSTYILDVVILSPIRRAVNMYSFFPFTQEKCSSTDPILMRSFRKIPLQITYEDLFPAKATNFHQCRIKVVLWNLPPFLELTHHNNGTISYKGFDGSMLREISKALNFSVDVIPNEPPDYISGRILRNQTATGVFKMLLEHRLNLTIGCIACFNDRLKVTSASKPYFIQQYVFVLRNSVTITPYELLLKPFHTSTWCILLGLLVVRSIVKNCCGHKMRTFTRPPLIYLLFFLRVSYEGSIFQVITKPPYQPLPLTIAELIRQNYTIITDYATNRILADIPYIRQISRIAEGPPPNVIQLVDKIPRNTAILTTETRVAHFMKSRLRNHSEYTLLREKLSIGMNCVFFPRSSFLVPAVNDVLSRLDNSGIKEKFEKEIGFENLPHTTDKWLRMRHSRGSSVLDLRFFTTVFIVMLQLHMLALVVFIMELMWFRIRRNSKRNP